MPRKPKIEPPKEPNIDLESLAKFLTDLIEDESVSDRVKLNAVKQLTDIKLKQKSKPEPPKLSRKEQEELKRDEAIQAYKKRIDNLLFARLETHIHDRLLEEYQDEIHALLFPGEPTRQEMIEQERKRKDELIASMVKAEDERRRQKALPESKAIDAAVSEE